MEVKELLVRLNTCHNKKSALTSKFKVCGIINFCFLLLLTTPSCRKQISAPEMQKPSPPDLSCCTHVELTYHPSTVDYFFWGDKEKSLLNTEEIEYLQSFKTIVVDDPEAIKALAHDVSLGTYSGPDVGSIGIKNVVYFNCYSNDELIKSFMWIGNTICTEDKQRFEYDKEWINLLQVLTPQIWKFGLRASCARNLRDLLSEFPWDDNGKVIYPKPSRWCNSITRHYWGGRRNKNISKYFKCPSVGEDGCNYAMNSNCKSDSPPDMVFLFETKAGWNQHGGPELFTFDNHDPRGGCVLLNDGTVKFIRTEEELHSLRWE
jgi:hypothetical protein